MGRDRRVGGFNVVRNTMLDWSIRYAGLCNGRKLRGLNRRWQTLSVVELKGLVILYSKKCPGPSNGKDYQQVGGVTCQREE